MLNSSSVFYTMKRTYISLVILLSGSIFGSVNAESACDNYPQPGFDIKRDEKGGEKFIATAEVSVPIDDRDLYMDSMEEAEIEAKLRIAKFLNEEISGSTNIEKKTKTQIRVEGEAKSLNSDMVKTKLKVLSSNTPKTLMRGVRVLGSCYNPGKAVRVSVGWKLQDLNSADKLRNSMKNSWNPTNFFNKKNESFNNNKNSKIDFSPVGGYSDKSRLDNF